MARQSITLLIMGTVARLGMRTSIPHAVRSFHLRTVRSAGALSTLIVLSLTLIGAAFFQALNDMYPLKHADHSMHSKHIDVINIPRARVALMHPEVKSIQQVAVFVNGVEKLVAEPFARASRSASLSDAAAQRSLVPPMDRNALHGIEKSVRNGRKNLVPRWVFGVVKIGAMSMLLVHQQLLPPLLDCFGRMPPVQIILN